jgi:hypothetical protein
MAVDQIFLEKLRSKNHAELLSILREILLKISNPPESPDVIVDTGEIARIVSDLKSDEVPQAIKLMMDTLSQKIDEIEFPKINIPENAKPQRLEIVRDQGGRIKYVDIKY